MNDITEMDDSEAKPMTYLIIKCSYCKKITGFKPCAPEMQGKVSHGICKPCEVKVNKELDKLLKGEKR